MNRPRHDLFGLALGGAFRVLTVLCLAWSVAASAQPAVPALTGRVVDLAGILSPTTEATLTARLAAHEDSTTNQIAVLTIASLQGAVLEEYATEVFRAWGLGTEEADNGVLLLVSRDDREIRIEVGYGLEGSVTDARAGRIIRDEMTPRFRQGDFDGGVLGGVDALIAAAEGQDEAVSAVGSGSGGAQEDMPWPFALFFGGIFGGIPLLSGYRGLLKPPVARYVLLIFTTLFVWVGSSIFLYGLVRLGSVSGLLGVIVAPLVLAVIVFGLGYPIVFIIADVVLSRSPEWQEKRAHYGRKQAAVRRAQKSGKRSVVVDGRTYRVLTYSSSGGGGGGGFSGGGGGGGFSGGGGSSGGGGASGGW